MRKRRRNPPFQFKEVKMKVVYGKTLSAEETSVVQNISVECGILFDTARLLFYRNIDTVEKAKKFLSPSESDLYDPFGLSGMKEATDRISLAKSRGESVLIFGDYDADGVCASTVLFKCMKLFGITPKVVVPEREEGYGLNPDKVLSIKEKFGTTLLITVDCGISDYEKIERIKAAGIDVIVTDHHEPPEVLPDCIRVNPKIKGQAYPFDGLCGAGVAYKLGYALVGKNANDYLDLVALATVADSMDLKDENRSVVSIGLKMLNGARKRFVFKKLMGETEKQIASQTLAFGFAPRLNAGGRMGDANTALKAFISDDENEVFDACVKLNAYNVARQTRCDDIYREAKQIISEKKIYLDDVILVCKDDWQTGFIGIVAARLVEDYNRPVIVFAETDGFYKGSARSVEEVNIHEAINAAKEYVIGFGGHSQAAGVSVAKDKFDDFKRAICAFVGSRAQGAEREKEIFVDMITDEKLSVRFLKEIDLLEPYGVGNRRPLFSLKTGAVMPKPLKEGSPHFVFNTRVAEMLDFNGQDDVPDLTVDTEKEIIYEPNYSVFRNKEYVKGFVKYILPDYGDFSVSSLKIFANELKKAASAQAYEYNAAPKKDIKLAAGRGTLYAVSDEKNLAEYDLSSFNKYLFEKKDKNNVNCVIVSPTYIPDGYDEIVYLDKPLSLLPAEKITVCDNVCGTRKITELSVDRSDFEKPFAYLRSLEGREFTDIVDSAERYKTDLSPLQTIFAAEVFFELGFFFVENGKLKRRPDVKKPLGESKIYQCVCENKVRI